MLGGGESLVLPLGLLGSWGREELPVETSSVEVVIEGAAAGGMRREPVSVTPVVGEGCGGWAGISSVLEPYFHRR